MVNILRALRETVVSEKSLVIEKYLELLRGEIWFGIEKGLAAKMPGDGVRKNRKFGAFRYEELDLNKVC